MKASHFYMRVTREKFNLDIHVRYFWKGKTCSYLAGQNIVKLSSYVKTGGNQECDTNQVQIFSVIKCIKASKVSLATHLANSFVI